jgi:hypothetical protein|tara:strand:- start:5728 stop:6522 length:795 start_codon:yes stop_codon:yes gene_type:complete
MANAVATKKETAISTDIMDDILEFAGEGATFDSSEMQIPFIRILQAMSPQLKKREAEYIEGAEQGDMFNTVTGDKFKGEDGMIVLPCYQTVKYLEFVPRDLGGGFQGEISPTDPVLQKTTRNGSKEILPNGHELVKSDQHFCLVIDADGITQPVVIDMKSTQLKVSRRWKTKIAMQKVKHPKTGAMVLPPLFATQWKFTTVEESNDQGSWFNYAIEKIGLVNDRDLLQEALTFRTSVAAGELKAAKDPEHQQKRAEEDADSIPF